MLLEASVVVVNISLLVCATLSALMVFLITVVDSVLVDIALTDDTLERVDDLELGVVFVVAPSGTETVR